MVRFLGRRYNKVIVQSAQSSIRDLVFDSNNKDYANAEITIDETRTFLTIDGITFIHPETGDAMQLIMPLASIKTVLVSIDELKQQQEEEEEEELEHGFAE